MQIEDELDGKVFAIVKLLGWVSIGLFVLSVGLLSGYYVWAGRRVNAVMKHSQSAEDSKSSKEEENT